MRSLVFALLLPAEALGAGLPAYFTAPLAPGDGVVVEEEYGEASFPIPDRDNAQRGRHWYAEQKLAGTTTATTGKALFAQSLRPALVAGGWTVVAEHDGASFHVTLRNQKGRDSWAHLWVISAADIRLDLIQVGPQPRKLKLARPAAQPESLSTADIPYLSPLPGSQRGFAQRVEGALSIPVDASSPEKKAIGKMVHHRKYRMAGLSNVQFVVLYADALEAAGWTIVREAHKPYGVIIAHYQKNGREIWAYLHAGGGEYGFQVAEAEKN